MAVKRESCRRNRRAPSTIACDRSAPVRARWESCEPRPAPGLRLRPAAEETPGADDDGDRRNGHVVDHILYRAPAVSRPHRRGARDERRIYFGVRFNESRLNHFYQAYVTRSIVYGVVGPCKTESSQKPVPVHPLLAILCQTGENSAPTRSQMTEFLPAGATGDRPFYESMFDRLRYESESRNASAGPRFAGTRIRRC